MSTPLATLLQHWRTIFPRRRIVRWCGDWLYNGYCPACRLCCGPQEEAEPFLMKLLPQQVRPGLDQDFYLLEADTVCLDQRGCRACTEHGCRLPREQRPVACGLFPFVLHDKELLLYLRCPASLFTPLSHMEALGHDVAQWLLQLCPADRRRIAITLPEATLADRYVRLHITL